MRDADAARQESIIIGEANADALQLEQSAKATAGAQQRLADIIQTL